MKNGTNLAVAGPLSADRPAQMEERAGLRARWWRIVDRHVGVVPLPVFLLLIAIIGGLTLTSAPVRFAPRSVSGGSIPADILTNIAILAVGGFACSEVGRHIPLLRKFGLPAILATFVPSYLVYAHWLPAPVVQSVKTFTEQTNFLFLFIAAIIVGSILGMDRRTLISGFLKIIVPMGLASIAAVAVGTLVGLATGHSLRHTLFFIVLPVLAGGVGEGAIPLSIGYAAYGQQDQGTLFAQLLPPVMLGSLIAIVLSGCLNFLGQRRMYLTGNGRLQPGSAPMQAQTAAAEAVDPATIAAAGVTAVALYLAGVLLQSVCGFPAPVTMLFFALVMKLGRIASPRLESGAFALYRFFSVAVTYPLLFAMGAAVTPWGELVAAFSLSNVVTIGATVCKLVTVGFFAGKVLRLYPVDTAIVVACRAAQGGTGDVAILTASNRMALMPFAQIATRIGGAMTVTVALVAFRYLH